MEKISLLRHRGGGFFHHRRKRSRIVNRKVRKDLAIKRDLRERKRVDQAAVGRTVRFRGGANARYPEIAELTLVRAAIAERVFPATVEGFHGTGVLIVPAMKKPSVSLKTFFLR